MANRQAMRIEIIELQKTNSTLLLEVTGLNKQIDFLKSESGFGTKLAEDMAKIEALQADKDKLCKVFKDWKRENNAENKRLKEDLETTACVISLMDGRDKDDWDEHIRRHIRSAVNVACKVAEEKLKAAQPQGGSDDEV